MDSFFKAAVCDLDKLLDDFELSSEELDSSSVFLKPSVSVYPVSSLDSSSVPPSLPDLNSLHYGSGSGSASGPEVRGQPLTGVDLLSSVGRGAVSQSSAPPCPDRALKPLCDLVNDTGSAALARADSHDAFRELDVVEQQMEQEQEQQEAQQEAQQQEQEAQKEEQQEALLVDFDSPVLLTETRDRLSLDSAAFSSSLSLLDVILPAAVETGAHAAHDSPPPPRTNEPAEQNGVDRREPEETTGSREEAPDAPAAADPPLGLSCLPIAVSMCGALVQPRSSEEEEEGPGPEPEPGPGSEPEPGPGPDQSQEADVCESTEADSLSALQEEEEEEQEEERPAPEGQNQVSVDQVSVDRVSVDRVSVDRVSVDRVSVDQVSVDRVSVDRVSVDRVSVDRVSVDRVSVDQVSVDRVSVDRVSVDQVSVDQVSVDQVSVDQVSVEQVCAAPPADRSPVDPAEFGFEYLPESDQAELLVTDEELDAFLQAHSEAEQLHAVCPPPPCAPSSSCCASSCPQPPHRDLTLENGLVEEELGGSAAPESDRTMCLTPAAPSQEEEQQEQQEEQEEHQPTGSSSEQQPSYGGARPKQLQTARPAPAGGEEEEEGAGGAAGGAEEEAEDSSSPVNQSLTEVYPPQEQQEYSGGYEELSEPPPYPGGESPTEGARTVSWRREGGAAEEEQEELGSRQPAWVPDGEAPTCMNCCQRFTFTRRRHHCRACGKVYCAVCCNRKCKLKYLEKEARVCVVCFDTIHRAQALERMMSPTGPSPNPNVPSEYCSTIPPLQQARAAGTLNSPPPTVMVPVSVLKHPNNDSCPRGEQKRVWFADGILPNGEVADTTKLSVPSRRSSQEFSGGGGGGGPDQNTLGPAGSEVGVGGGASSPEACVEVQRPPVSGPWDYALLAGLGSSVKRLPSLLPDNEDELPPLLIATGEEAGGGDVLVEESPAPCQILHLLEEGGPRPLTFVLNANLLVNVKLVTYAGRQCWCLGSNGLQALGQRELVFLLECLPEEKTLPRDLFSLYLSIYQDAQRGKFVEELDNVTFTSSFLGSKDHAGMLFFSPSCQPLDGLTLPPQPFLLGLLIQKLEVPWAKVFPLRLLLRLGAQYSVYPTPLTSVRFRDSVYRETGHTIMNLLADLRNYQYSLSVVEGLRIHMEMGHSYIDIPRSSFTDMQKVVNSANEHVISIGARFSSEADSHLVCFQNDEGNYQTQANSKPGQTRTVTGASFVVFNGALKASSGFIAKSSIVEDGLMIQIPPETMESLRAALRDQTDFHIPCGKNDGGESRENVTVRWIDWSSPVNTGKTSGVDGRPLDGVRSVRMQQDTEFESDGRTISCTEVFYQLQSPACSLSSVLSSCSVFQKEMALATCSALTPHLAVLAASGINSFWLRVSTQTDMVEYQAGSSGRLLPQRYMNELDGALIPVIHGGSASVPATPMDLEFLFYITHTH